MRLDIAISQEVIRYENGGAFQAAIVQQICDAFERSGIPHRIILDLDSRLTQRLAMLNLSQDQEWEEVIDNLVGAFSSQFAAHLATLHYSVGANTTTMYNNIGIDWNTARFTVAATTANAGPRLDFNPGPETPAARKARLAFERKMEKANERAEILLHDLVGESVYKLWTNRKRILVPSRKAKGTLAYDIRARQMIKLFDRQRPEGGWKDRKDRLCIHLAGQFPEADEVAALFVLARYDEEALWKEANYHPFRQLRFAA
jgi:hypothetical protein